MSQELKMSKSKYDGQEVVGLGMVNEFTIEVIEEAGEGVTFYQWRAFKGEELAHWPHNLYDTIDDAISGSILWIIPDVEPVHVTEPEPKDFEALSMLLYCGGLNQELETLAEVITMHNDFQHAIEMIEKGRVKARKDFEYAVSALKAT